MLIKKYMFLFLIFTTTMTVSFIKCQSEMNETLSMDEVGTNDVVVDDLSALSDGEIKPILTFEGGSLDTLVSSKSKVDQLSAVFKKNIDKLKSKHKRLDIVFLIDSSSSVGKANFESEIKFVKKLLSDFPVSYEYTRVAIVTFSSQAKIYRHVDQISKPSQLNDKCMLLNHQINTIGFSGGGTHTYGAFQEAKKIFENGRLGSKKLIFLVTDGFSNGGDPVPIANELKQDNITIYTIGIQSGNYEELYNISSSPGQLHSYLLDSFGQFESLARKALHADYKVGENLKVHERFCNVLCIENDEKAESDNCCDKNAECSCDTNSGHYKCLCKPGYFGSGLANSCQVCANGTYSDAWNECKSCPDKNHITLKEPALSITDCVCKSGFKSGDRNNCETITCPELTPPKNGYFVTSSKGCGQVLNAACGARCKSGFLLTGSSIRLCQENGTWSGTEAECVLKTCPALKVPYYGQAICKNPDLNLFFDYSPRNETFMVNYSRDVEKFTERMPIDTECTFKCGSGFYIVGSRKRNCLPLKEGKWDGLQTSCKQILCQPLPKVKFGQYEPADCTEDKSEHGSNCTLTCDFGFELKGGPSTRVCNGKRNGIWSHKNKNPRCVDVTPPHLTCPGDYSLPLDPDLNYTLIRQLHQPYVFDNSGENVTFWSRPALKENVMKLGRGNHTITYIAVDNFKNKAKCTFVITVMDINPPVFEECIDPPTLYIGAEKNKNTTFLEWEEPTVYDNSFDTVHLNKSLDFGYLDVGVYSVTYFATDTSGNMDECSVNVTIKERKCDNIEAPANGQSICVRNITHTVCELSCNVRYGFYSDGKELSDTSRHTCENRKGIWTEKIPDCSLIETPESVEEVFTISLDADPLICDSSTAQEELQFGFISVIKEHMCNNQDDCEISSALPVCDNIESGTVAENSTYYNVVKREIGAKAKSRETRANVNFKVYTSLGKRLGLWQYNISKIENIQKIKAELESVSTNKDLKRKLIQYKIDITGLKLDEIAKCNGGSVSKKLACVQCPPGTYHNATLNSCQSCPIGTYNDAPGRTECTPCPFNYVTRKTHSKSFYDCKALCPPGTIAKLKPKSGAEQHPNSLMPYCRKCNPGEYNSQYNQLSCEKCPTGHFSIRGSTSLENCTLTQLPCLAQPCGKHGKCVPEKNDNFLYTCVCDEGFVGAHCELWENSCLSAPCYNGGTCTMTNEGRLKCDCGLSYHGQFCESFRDPCQESPCKNGGSCVEISGKVVCECPHGFEGERCEIYNNFCDSTPCEMGVCVNSADGFSCICPPGQIGRRCHLKPCDYVPCHGSSVCVDVVEDVTTKDSYRCECPIGLKGQNCTEVDNPCDHAPCKNNGICTPVALRSLRQTSIFSRYIDDQKYDEFKCDCPPFFYGKTCETLVTPDFIMEFQKTNVNNYIKMQGPKENLQEISFCAWLKTNDTFNYGTLLSYAAGNVDNMFTLTDYNGLILYVNGTNTITDIVINDGFWHFVCVTWRMENGYYEIYLDGRLVSSGVDLNSNGEIQGNGLLIIGQEQDTLGASFSESESFIGMISYLDIWKRALNGYEVEELYTSCEPYQGDLYAWTDFKLKTHGNIKTYPSNFCKSCSRNLTIVHGTVMYVGNNALYQCDEGYLMEGSAIRHCLRTSYWEKAYPVCKLIRCGYVGSISNGNVTVTKSSYNGTATFTCDAGYEIIGPSQRICQLNGKWSESNPECVSKHFCDPLTIPENSSVIYATEKGTIRDKNATELRTGTLAEIQCMPGTHPNGDNLITCLNDGSWDNNPPECIPDQISAEIIEVEEIVITETTTETSTSIPVKVNQKRIPDRLFWKSLHSYLFFGCTDSIKRSSLCDKYPSNLTDLNVFEVDSNRGIQNTDQGLIKLFESTLASDGFLDIDIGTLFEFILYQNKSIEVKKMDKNMEDSFRLTLCFYINILSSEIPTLSSSDSTSESTKIEAEENIGRKIIRLIRKIVQPVFDKYVELEQEPEKKNKLNGVQALMASKEASNLKE